MGKHGKSKKHSRKHDSRSDSDSSDSSDSTSKTIFGLVKKLPKRTYDFEPTPSNPTLADYLSLVKSFGAPSMWTLVAHNECTSIYATELAILKHAVNRNVIVPDWFMERLALAVAEHPNYQSLFDILKKELEERREFYRAESQAADQAAIERSGGGGGGNPTHEVVDGCEHFGLTQHSSLKEILKCKELDTRITRAELSSMLQKCALEIDSDLANSSGATIKSLTSLLNQTEKSDDSPVHAIHHIQLLKTRLLVHMQILKPSTVGSRVRSRYDDDSDYYSLPEIGDNDGIPKPRIDANEAHQIGHDNLVKLRGFSRAVFRITRKLSEHHQLYLEMLTRCAEQFKCEKMKTALREWGTLTPEDKMAKSSVTEKIFNVLNLPLLFMGVVDRNLVGLKIVEAVREDETRALNSLSPLSTKNDAEHARAFRTQADKCAEVGCNHSDVTLVIKFLYGYQYALGDSTVSSPRAVSARFVYDKLKRIFDDMTHQKRFEDVKLTYFLDLAARTSAELNEGALQTGNTQHHQRGGGHSSRRGKPASTSQPYDQFAAAAAAAAAAAPTDQPKAHPKSNKRSHSKQNRGGGGSGGDNRHKGNNQGKGKGPRPPYCNTCKQNHVPYGDECSAPRNQPQTRGGQPPNTRQAATNLASDDSQQLFNAFKLLSEKLGFRPD